MDEMFLPKPRKAKPVTEKQVEKDSKARVKDDGGLSLKFTSPGRRNVPDQIELYGIEPMRVVLRNLMLAKHGYELSDDEELAAARELLAAGIQFTECKRPGKKPTAGQEREHARLRALGFQVNVVDQRK